jgi:hypothetical protein
MRRNLGGMKWLSEFLGPPGYEMNTVEESKWSFGDATGRRYLGSTCVGPKKFHWCDSRGASYMEIIYYLNLVVLIR